MAVSLQLQHSSESPKKQSKKESGLTSLFNTSTRRDDAGAAIVQFIMLKVLLNVVKYFFGILQRMLYPAKRLICRRRKLSASDAVELTSVGSGDGFPMSNSVSGSLPQNEADLEMEAWDSWGDTGGGSAGQQNQGQQQHNNFYNNGPSAPMAPPPATSGYHEKPSANGHRPHQHQYTHHHHQQQQQQHHHQHRNVSEPEPEMDMNFFEDMTPSVRKQKKFLVRKKEMNDPSSFSTRLGVTSDVPMQTTSELESWEDSGVNAWEDNAEAAEDMTWHAEEAIREKKKKDRMDRQVEQQKKKQKRDEMRGMKGGVSLAATKLS